MRHWLFIVMIALLPLRGWAAATMAGQMPASHAGMAAMPVNAAHAVAEPMPDCPGHAPAGEMPAGASADLSAVRAGAGAAPAPGDCHVCASCQICHTVAVPVNAALPALTFSPHAPPSSGGARFASAPTAQGLKPPIS